MFLPPEIRPVPRWEPPKPNRRRGDPATILILLVVALCVLAPVGGGTFVAMVWALRKLWWWPQMRRGCAGSGPQRSRSRLPAAIAEQR